MGRWWGALRRRARSAGGLFFLLAAWLGGVRGQEPSFQWAFSVRPGFISSSAALGPDGTTVYLGVETQSGGRIIAVTREGGLKWSRLTSEFVDSSPAFGPDGTLYVGGVDGRLYALNPDTGASRWELNVRSFITSSPAVGADGTIYFGAGDGQLRAVSPAGVVLWAYPTANAIESSPAIAADGTIYIGSYDRYLYAVSRDGIEKWRFATGGRIYSSPAIGADGTIYFGSGDQKLYALRPDGVKKWEYFTNGDIQASPVLGADGTVYFGGLDANFYALQGDDGTERWKVSVNATIGAPAAVCGDGTIIFGADDGKVRALLPESGAVRWTYDTGSRDLIEAGPLVAPDGSIYLGSLDGRLYKLGGGSPLSAYASWPAFRRDPGHTGRANAVSRGQLLNLSTRAQVAGNNTVTVGFFVQGAGAKAYLMRGIGPALAQFGISGVMSDPRLDLYSGAQFVTGNDNWDEVLPGLSVPETSARVGAFPLPPGSRDAALLIPLPPGLYTARVRNVDAQTGVALVEAYDAIGGDDTARLVNVSTLGPVGATRENFLVAGVAVGGTGPSRLLVRGAGPALTQFGVTGALARPVMSVYAVAGNSARLLRTNSGWTTEGYRNDLSVAGGSVAAFPLAPGSADAAILLTVEPGNYTVEISGSGGSTGQALVELYVLP